MRFRIDRGASNLGQQAQQIRDRLRIKLGVFRSRMELIRMG